MDGKPPEKIAEAAELARQAVEARPLMAAAAQEMAARVEAAGAGMPAKPPPPPPWYHDGFAFTDAGCRTEVRVGVLITLAAVFLWLFAGPVFSSRLFLFIGLPLLLWGVPVQAIQGRAGRPGYPLKLGLILAIGGALMWPELRWQERVGGPVEVQTVAWLPLGTGLWILLWWPIAVWGTKKPAGAAA